MLKYVLSRAAQFPLILAVIYLTTVALVWVAPGDPFAASSEKISPARVAALQARYHTDSFWSFLSHYPLAALQGDLGPSLSRRGYRVSDILADALPVSLAVGTLAIVLAGFAGVFIGTVAAVRRNGVIDYASLAVALVGVSVPSFVVATGLLGAFAYDAEAGYQSLYALLQIGILAAAVVACVRQRWWWQLGVIAAVVVVSLFFGFPFRLHAAVINPLTELFPLGGWPGTEGRGYSNLAAYDSAVPWFWATLDYLRHMILPAAALSLLPMAYITRLTRVSMIDVLGSEYVRTARAKGLSKFKVVFKHCLRNAFLPVLSFLGPAAANVLVGSFVVETIFHLPGLGPYFIESVQFRDQPMILGTVLVYSLLLLTLNLAVDLLYGVVDPRISVATGGGK